MKCFGYWLTNPDQKKILHLLKNSFPQCSFLEIKNLKEMKFLLHAEEADLFIFDFELIGFASLEYIKNYISQHPNSRCALLALCHHYSPLKLSQLLHAGVDQIYWLQWDLTCLAAYIHKILISKKKLKDLYGDRKKLETLNQYLAKISITDGLTKLYNMKYFHNRLEQEFIRTMRYKKNLSVIIFDLDYFKLVNDKCNHLMGSYVLSEIGRLLAESIRTDDIPARFGGDEFVVLLPETSYHGACHLAQRILNRIKDAVFIMDSYRWSLTASMGLASVSPEARTNLTSGEDLLKYADEFLYKAKEEGRNRYLGINL